MTTPGRYYALQWIADHEAFGPDAMLSRKPPTRRMQGWMLKEGQVTIVPVGQFGFHNWRLTPRGREVLAKKPKVRRPNAERYQTMRGAARGVESE